MASAAYWIGSQAHEVVMIRSGDVGSIGVYSLHEDWSGHLEQEGIKITTLKFGDRKIEGAPWEPLDDEARAHFQGQVNQIGREFQAAVARGRGVDVAQVRREFGDGRVFGAKEAMKRGLVDRVATLDETIARVASGRRGGRRFSALAAQARADRDLLDATLAEMECPASAPSLPSTDDQAAADRERNALILAACPADDAGDRELQELAQWLIEHEPAR